MATPANESGIGGKFRRRPFRKATPTPYDRPPTALRGVRGSSHVAEDGGWISKLMDPTSRLIADGAWKLFSSVFRKRLTAPSIKEADKQSREDGSQPTSTVPLSEVQNGTMEGGNQTDDFDSDGIAELEQLLGQKTFTRVEFDRLAELLRSRTVETVEHENNDKKKGKTGLSVPENGIGSSRINENHSVSGGGLTLAKQIVMDEAASPAELAKAYMGSRTSEVPSSVGSLRNQVFQEDANLPSMPSTSKQLDLSVAPRSGIRFSGITEHPEHGSQTAKPARAPGRSAIYRMSRSPYFKANPASNVQVGESSRDGYSHPSSSRWTPGSMKSSGKQPLKRGSAALEDEFVPVVPVRRIRQKSNLMSPSKEAFSSLSGKYVYIPSTPSLKDSSKGSMPVQKPLLLDERKYSSVSQTENGITNSTMARPQSSERAHKLFQQLDKLLPSPKEKLSRLKSIARDDSPSKLTLDMLRGSALRSMEEVNSSKFFSMQEKGTLDNTASDSQRSNIRNNLGLKLDMTEENGPSKSNDLEVKLTSEANCVSDVPTPSKDAMHGGRSKNIAASNSVAIPAVKKPAFRIAAPEGLMELDDDEYLPRPSTTPNDDADTRKSKHSDAISETTVSDKPPTSSSQIMHISSPIFFRKADMKAFGQPVVTEKDNGFVFPVASDPCMQTQPPPTPTMPTPQLDKPDMQQEHTSSPIFCFGSQDVNTATVSSTTISVDDTSGINIGERSGSELISAISAPTNLAEGSTIDKSGKQMDGGTFNSSVDTVPSGMPVSSTPATFSFGAVASTGLSNGSLHASASTCLAPSTASTTFSEGPVSSVLANSTSSSSTSSSTSSSVSSAAATFSTASAFQFGSAMSTTVPFSISQPLDKSNSTAIGANSVKASPFDMACSMAQGASSVFPSAGSSSSPDVATTVSIFSGTSPFTSSSLFSSMTGSSSSVATSTASPSTENNLFGFNASSSIQSICSSPSLATSSQNSTATIFGANGVSLGSSPRNANNFSQNSTASTFGSIDGSVFGTQSKSCGNDSSQMSQSSTSQFGSFNSPPSFGLANSSLGSLGVSPFGSATSGSNHFTSSSGVVFSSSAINSSSFAPASTTGPFGASSQATTSSIISATSNSSTSASTGLTFGSSASGSNIPSFTFGSSSSLSTSPFTGASSSIPSTTTFAFGLSSGASSSPFTGSSSSGSSSTSFTFGLSSGSSTSPFTVGSSSGSSSSPFTFGVLSGSSSSPFTVGSSSASSSSPFAFGSSSGSSSTPFVFGTSSGSAFSTSSCPTPAFGAQKPAFGFGAGSPGNDQMNVEDSMTDVTNNVHTPLVPTFGQSANPAAPSFVFGAPSAQPVAPPAFQFGGLQNPSVPQNPSPFQPAGNTDFNPGGSFSLGSGGGDKSARRFVKVKRGPRKK